MTDHLTFGFSNWLDSHWLTALLWVRYTVHQLILETFLTRIGLSSLTVLQLIFSLKVNLHLELTLFVEPSTLNPKFSTSDEWVYSSWRDYTSLHPQDLIGGGLKTWWRIGRCVSCRRQGDTRRHKEGFQKGLCRALARTPPIWGPHTHLAPFILHVANLFFIDLSFLFIVNFLLFLPS